MCVPRDGKVTCIFLIFLAPNFPGLFNSALNLYCFPFIQRENYAPTPSQSEEFEFQNFNFFVPRYNLLVPLGTPSIVPRDTFKIHRKENTKVSFFNCNFLLLKTNKKQGFCKGTYVK